MFTFNQYSAEIRKLDLAFRVCVGKPTYRHIHKLTVKASKRISDIGKITRAVENSQMVVKPKTIGELNKANPELVAELGLLKRYQDYYLIHQHVNSEKYKINKLNQQVRDILKTHQGATSIFKTMNELTVKFRKDNALDQLPLLPELVSKESDLVEQYIELINKFDELHEKSGVGTIYTYYNYTQIKYDLFMLDFILNYLTEPGSESLTEASFLFGTEWLSLIGKGPDIVREAGLKLKDDYQAIIGVPGIPDILKQMDDVARTARERKENVKLDKPVGEPTPDPEYD